MSSASKMLNFTNTTCTNVDFEASVVITTLSLLLFLIICFISAFGSHGSNQKGTDYSSLNLFLLFLGLLSAGLTALTVPGFRTLYFSYRVTLVVGLGVVVTVIGDRKFFVVPNDFSVLRPLGFHHPDTSFFIWAITIPLALLEMFEAIGALVRRPDVFVAVPKGIAVFQKLIQGSIYHFSLRHKTVRPGREQSASWYLKALAMLNFTLWLDSIMNDTEGVQYLIELFGNGLSILSSAMNALLIDYRLFCCLLFAEHAVSVESQTAICSPPCSPDPGQRPRQVNNPIQRAEITHWAGLGYLLGFVCFGLQLIAALQYANFVGPWSNIFVLGAEILVVLSGLVLLLQPGVLSGQPAGIWKERHSRTLDVMVALMGSVGFAFWLFKTTVTSVWTVRHVSLGMSTATYLLWTTIKTATRCIGILFQLYLYGKVGPLFGCKEGNSKSTYFVLPILMLGLLSVFTSSVIDAYSGHIEDLIEDAKLNRVLQAFWKAGGPIHLGFALHMFLHFWIVNSNMRASRIARHLSSRNLHYTSSRYRSASAPLRDASQLLKEPLLSEFLPNV